MKHIKEHPRRIGKKHILHRPL